MPKLDDRYRFLLAAALGMVFDLGRILRYVLGAGTTVPFRYRIADPACVWQRVISPRLEIDIAALLTDGRVLTGAVRSSE